MSQSNIEVYAIVKPGEAYHQVVRQAAEETLNIVSPGHVGSLTVLLADDDYLRELNHRFLGINEPTDVLSFPAGEESGIGNGYLGDIAVSLPMAERQAQKAGHTLLAELQLLVVHGILHLLGYDHAEAAEKTEMWKAQEEILRFIEVDLDLTSIE